MVHHVERDPPDAEPDSRPEPPVTPASSIAIELRHLRYFLAVAEELHFSRAAERLHIAQPPLSQAIRRLELELGVRLLERTSRVVSITEAGRVFAEEARRVLAEFDRAVTEARRAGGAGRLRIGCLPHLPFDRLQRFLKGLQERDPRWHSEVTHLLSLEQVRWLRAGRLELGILYGAGEHEEIELEPLFAGDPLAALLPATHRLAARERVGPDDLRDERLVLFPRAANPSVYDQLLAAFEAAGYRFSDVYETGVDRRAIALAVALGQGVALAPSSLVEAASDPDPVILARPLDPSLAMPDTMLAWRADPPPRLRAAITAARTLARELRAAAGGAVVEPGRARPADR
ncbi:MAG: hypothetical protein QOK40_2868 [Miltoncostaeaceae bacterium]|nr:hypothetical protein [Miltoncostaeaceae bacterium]